MTLRLTRALTASLLACTLAGAALAADFTGPTSDEKLAPVRSKIEARQWDSALADLRRINDTQSADWNNLMGYSLRKADPANAGEAEKFYNEALRIEPRHRGALEYSGELYLMTGNLAKAEERLAALDKACFLPCEEYTDLKKAVARYKAAGNKYVAQ